MMCGWLEPIELNDEDVDIENLKPISDGGESYIIYNKAHPDEYYMIENRQRKYWDAGLPTKGLMITHVDFDIDIWNDNTPNTKVTKTDVRYYGYSKTNDHQRCTIFHADNDDDSKYWNSQQKNYTKTTLKNDLYPYVKADSLTNTSEPAASLYNENTDGTNFMNKRILNIKQNTDGTVSFKFRQPEGSETNGIEATVEDKQQPETYFDLSGRCISKPTKGIYIINRKKIVVR